VKAILLVESSLNAETFSAVEHALRHQLRPVFLTNDVTRYEGVPGAMRQLSRAEVRHVDTNSADALIAVGQAMPSVAGIMSLCDFNTLVVAQAAAKLRLPGASPDAVALARNKYLVREAGRRHGLPSPRFALCHDRAELRAALAHAGLPCVVKPVTDTAGNNVALCHDVAEADELLSSILAEKVNARGQEAYPGAVAEELLGGSEVSVELVLSGGVPVFSGVTDKLVSPGSRFIETGHTYPSAMSASRQAEATEFAVAALAAIGFDHGPAHVELMMTESGPRLIEVNPRLAGGGIPGLVEVATGVSLREAVLLFHAGLDARFPPSATRAASMRFLLSPASGVASSLHGMAQALAMDGVVEGQWHVTPGTLVREATSNRDRLAHVVCQGATPHEAARRAAVAIGALSARVNR
jgi:S-sulfo-L-cysteine synthase (3-phospho-L-serine-dependent)